MKKREIFISIIFLIVISLTFINCVYAAGEISSNQTLLEAQAGLCLNESRDIMAAMQIEGFNVVRVNDSIKENTAIYESQLILKSKKKSYDFSSIVKSCEDIKAIKDSAEESMVELGSLLKYYNESITSKMDSSSVDKIIGEIKAEIRDERYENVPKLIENAYTELANVQASQTALKLFSAATARGLKVFILNNWKVFSTLIILILVLYLFYRVKISIWILTNKIEGLKNRKKTIKELVMQTQKNYFQYGKIAEGEYNIKTKKYAELMRDIDRQIPLLQEELAKLSSGG